MVNSVNKRWASPSIRAGVNVSKGGVHVRNHQRGLDGMQTRKKTKWEANGSETERKRTKKEGGTRKRKATCPKSGESS